MKIAIIIASDRCARGEAADLSGPAIQGYCIAQGWSILNLVVIPDELRLIEDALCEAADTFKADLVLTSGGTGLGPRDHTPEATLHATDRLVPGIAEVLRAESLSKTPFAMLSRGVAGLRGQTLIINLPGSPRAVIECLEILRPILDHAVLMMAGGSH